MQKLSANAIRLAEAMGKISESMAWLSSALRELNRALPKRRWAKVVRRKN